MRAATTKRKADPSVLPIMFSATPLMIQRDNGEQVVRMPRASDGVGSALRRVYGEGDGIPPDLAALLGEIDRASRCLH